MGSLDAKMKALQILFVVLVAAAAAHAQSFHVGRCPEPAVQQGFQVSQYLGKWYEIEKLPAVFQKGTCTQADYTLRDATSINVLNQGLLEDGEINEAHGSARIVDLSEPAKLEVSFFPGTGGPYWVVSTDYTTYSVVYSCRNYPGGLYADYAWVLSRTRTLPADQVTELKDMMKASGIILDRMTATPQTGCEAMP